MSLIVGMGPLARTGGWGPPGNGRGPRRERLLHEHQRSPRSMTARLIPAIRFMQSPDPPHPYSNALDFTPYYNGRLFLVPGFTFYCQASFSQVLIEIVEYACIEIVKMATRSFPKINVAMQIFDYAHFT